MSYNIQTFEKNGIFFARVIMTEDGAESIIPGETEKHALRNLSKVIASSNFHDKENLVASIQEKLNANTQEKENQAQAETKKNPKNVAVSPDIIPSTNREGKRNYNKNNQ